MGGSREKWQQQQRLAVHLSSQTLRPPSTASFSLSPTTSVTIANAAAAAAAGWTRVMVRTLPSGREQRHSERQMMRPVPAAMPGKAQVAAPVMLAAAAAATVQITAVRAAEWQRWDAAPWSTPPCGGRSVSVTLCRQSCRISPLLRAVRFVTPAAQAPSFDGSPASWHRVRGDAGAVAML